MLTLNYEGERATIHGNGHVNYQESRYGVMVMTEAPTETIQRMVLAVMPVVISDVTRAELRVAQIKAKMEVATNKVVDADNAKYLAASDAQIARSERVALSAELKMASRVLQLARVSAANLPTESLQPDLTWREQYNRNNP